MKTALQNFLQIISKNKSEKRHFLKVVLPSFLIHFIAGILALALMIVMTRTLGARQYGIFAYSFSIVFVLVSFFTNAINILTVREIPSLLSKGKVELWKGYSKWSSKLILIICLALPVLSIAFIITCTYYFHILKETVYIKPLLLAITAIPFCILMNYYASSLKGQNKPVLSLLPDNIIKPTLFLISFSVLYLFLGTVNVKYAILINSGSFSIGFLFAYIAYRRVIRPVNVEPQYDIKKWTSSLQSLFLLTVLASINSRLDILILGFIKEASQVGIYSIANRIADALTIFLVVMNLINSATISRMHTLNEKEKLQAMITKIARWVMLFSLPVFIGIVVFSKRILSFFGHDFSDGETALIIICSAQLVNISFGPVGNLSIMTGNEKYNIIFSCIRICLTITLNLILTPTFGILGTAIATASSIIFWNAGMFITVKRKTGFSTWIFGGGKI